MVRTGGGVDVIEARSEGLLDKVRYVAALQGGASAECNNRYLHSGQQLVRQGQLNVYLISIVQLDSCWHFRCLVQILEPGGPGITDQRTGQTYISCV
jgi:hypothetical protein